MSDREMECLPSNIEQAIIDGAKRGKAMEVVLHKGKWKVIAKNMAFPELVATAESN